MMRLVLEAQVESLQKLGELAQGINSLLQGKCIVLLQGPMGAGKTAFVKQIAKLRGIKEVTSPTFTFHQRYQPGFDHFDLYRVGSPEDLESTGFFDTAQSAEGLVFVEWPERLFAGEASAAQLVQLAQSIDPNSMVMLLEFVVDHRDRRQLRVYAEEPRS